MRNDDTVGLKTTKAEKTVLEMLNAIGDTLSNLRCSDHDQHWEDEEGEE